MNKPHLPPFKVEKVKGFRLLAALSNWMFKHFKIQGIWEHTQGELQKVCVLDTGCDHKDIDVKKKKDFTGQGIEDKSGHGTWVSGWIRATMGFLGIAPKCELYIGKILTDDGTGQWGWMKQGLEWAEEEGADVINISAGGDYSGKEIQPVIKRLADKGVLIVCAAGNTGNLLIYPASDPNTIAIGACTEEWERAEFSSFGPCLIALVPGVDLLGCWLDNGYAKATGTSMASPGAAGVLALEKRLRSMNLKQAITRFALTSTDVGLEEGWDMQTGWGIMDPWKFLKLEPSEKKITWKWIWALIAFLLFYWLFGIPVVGIKKMIKGGKV